MASRRAAAVTKLRSAELLRLGFVMALAMTLHNMPEGFAVRALSDRHAELHVMRLLSSRGHLAAKEYSGCDFGWASACMHACMLSG